jgi:hypothetical protein
VYVYEIYMSRMWFWKRSFSWLGKKMKYRWIPGPALLWW